MKAMLLAAGLGTRLRPYSLHKPKPLFPVLNIPLLQLNLNRLRNAGFETEVQTMKIGCCGASISEDTVKFH